MNIKSRFKRYRTTAQENTISEVTGMIPSVDSKEVHKRIKEFGNMRKNAGKNNAALLEVALFVEDVFGIFLSDTEICEDNLGTHQDAEIFVLKKLDP